MVIALSGLIAIVIAGLAIWRWQDMRTDRETWLQLAGTQPGSLKLFDESLIRGLPEPAQRYFRFSIKSGTPLYPLAEVSMQGDLSLGSKETPDYIPMQASQILAAPHGFLWRIKAGKALLRITGSDGANEGNSWSHFWLLGIVPVARAGGNSDHARSAFGRYVAEAIFWTPAAVLPDKDIFWMSVDDNTARISVTHKNLHQEVDVTVDSNGQPLKVVLQRWSNANPDKQFRLQPFGGYLSEFRQFGGYNLPTRVLAGNHFETDDYFPFYRVNVTDVRFPKPPARD